MNLRKNKSTLGWELNETDMLSLAMPAFFVEFYARFNSLCRACAARGQVIALGLETSRYISAESFKILTFRSPLQRRKASLRI